MSRRIFQNSAFIKALCYAQPVQRKLMIEFISQDQIHTISDIAKKILQGRLTVNNIHREKLKHHKRTIRFLANQESV